MDWGDGRYELISKTLEPAAQVTLDALGSIAGARLLDIGCGNGNAALVAAQRGATVTGVDPAPRLLEVARERAKAAGVQADFLAGDGANVPGGDASFDLAVSVFAIIFAPDARAVAAELKRVVRPGGRLAMTAWLPRGAVFEVGMILRKSMMANAPAPSPGTIIPQWHDEGFVTELFGGARVTTTQHAVEFAAASAEAWFAEYEIEHPIWRGARAMLSQQGTWDAARAECIAALRKGETPRGFSVPGEYVAHVIHF